MDHNVWKVSSPPSTDKFPHLAILPFTYFCWTPLRCRQHFCGNIAPILPLFYKQHFCIPHQAEIWVVKVLSKNTVKIQSYVLKGAKRKKTFWMKELLGKEHDCYKIHTLLTKSVSCYLLPVLSITSLHGSPPPSSFFTKISWSPSSMIFHKSQPLSLWVRGFTLGGKFSLLWHGHRFC